MFPPAGPLGLRRHAFPGFGWSCTPSHAARLAPAAAPAVGPRALLGTGTATGHGVAGTRQPPAADQFTISTHISYAYKLHCTVALPPARARHALPPAPLPYLCPRPNGAHDSCAGGFGTTQLPPAAAMDLRLRRRRSARAVVGGPPSGRPPRAIQRRAPAAMAATRITCTPACT